MSSPLAIGAVSAVLRNLLDDGLVEAGAAIGSTVNVSAVAPDTIALDAPGEPPRLNLFLYRVTPNIGWCNAALPSRSGVTGERLTNAPLALDLHYVLTAYGRADFQAEILLGYAMHLLHERPVLDRDAIRRALSGAPLDVSMLPPAFQALAQADLADQVEQIKVTPKVISGEDMSKLWAAIQTHYRPSSAYEVSVVLIEGTKPGVTSLPVLSRGRRDPVTLKDRGVVVNADLLPPLPTLFSAATAAAQTGARLGEQVIVEGVRLAGAGHVVRLGHRLLDQPVELGPEFGECAGDRTPLHPAERCRGAERLGGRPARGDGAVHTVRRCGGARDQRNSTDPGAGAGDRRHCRAGPAGGQRGPGRVTAGGDGDHGRAAAGPSRPGGAAGARHQRGGRGAKGGGDRSAGLRLSRQPGRRAALGPAQSGRRGQHPARPDRAGAGLRCVSAADGAGMNAAADTLGAAPVSWAERNRDWLVAALGRLRARLEAGEQAAADCVGEAEGFTPALVHCGDVFGLSVFERELLLLMAGVQLDDGLRRAVAAQQADGAPRVSFGLALGLLAAPHWDAISPEAPLRRWRLVAPEGGDAALAPLCLDERILHYLAGVAAPDAVLAGLVTPVAARAGAHEDDLPLIRHLAGLAASAERPGPVVVLRGARAAAARDLALAVAAEAGRGALWVEAGDLPGDPEALARLARHLDREVAMTGALPVISAEEGAAAGLVARLRAAVLWLGEAAPRLFALPEARRVLRFEVPAPDAARSRATLAARWQAAAPAMAREDAEVAAALARAGQQFHLGPAVIDGVVDRALAAPGPERPAAIWQAAREAARGGLDGVAERVESRAGFDDLVLPTGQTAILQDIARHLRQRERVYRDWGFGSRTRLGQGLVALFAGKSGTGKTLAAEAIANAVDLDLYRVDLASVVSKYIGETEKNLKRLFEAAEVSGAVLLFDEADALFGKRSEVKDSHDRYANIEIAYLLQRLEAYRGLAVLTTNMKASLDHAFMRRIRFVVNFPFPDPAAREAIWRRQFPVAAPMGEVDFAALARINLPGGNIRSIAVNAAFKAADAGQSIDQALLMAAAREEFAKLERSLTGAKGGRHAG